MPAREPCTIIMLMLYLVIFSSLAMLEARAVEQKASVVIQDSNELKRAVAERADLGGDVEYDQKFLHRIAGKLRKYIEKISENINSIEDNVLKPINETIDSMTTKEPKKSRPSSSDDEDEEDREPTRHHSHKTPKNHGQNAESDPRDKLCDDFNNKTHQDDLLEADVAEECARRAKKKQKKPRSKTSGDRGSDDDEKVDDVDRDKRGSLRGLNVFSEMFLKKEPK